MTTTYPGAIDSFDTHVDGVDDVMAADVNNPCDSIVALETAIGSEGPCGLCEGRLTLLTNVPVTLADQTAKTSVFFTPFKGNRIALYDGTGWVTHVFTQKALDVPATTSTPFDVFAYSSSGAVTLEALSWTNDTTRATALTYQDGVEVKTGVTTRRYLGTCRTTGVSGQTEDSVANRLVWNRYNQVYRRLLKADATGHDYNVATWRAWNNDASILTGFVMGLAEDILLANVTAYVSRDAANDGHPAVQVYLNGAGSGNYIVINLADAYVIRQTLTDIVDPRVGYNYLNVYQYTFPGATAPTYTEFLLKSMIRG